MLSAEGHLLRRAQSIECEGRFVTRISLAELKPSPNWPCKQIIERNFISI